MQLRCGQVHRRRLSAEEQQGTRDGTLSIEFAELGTNPSTQPIALNCAPEFGPDCKGHRGSLRVRHPAHREWTRSAAGAAFAQQGEVGAVHDRRDLSRTGWGRNHSVEVVTTPTAACGPLGADSGARLDRPCWPYGDESRASSPSDGYWVEMSASCFLVSVATLMTAARGDGRAIVADIRVRSSVVRIVFGQVSCSSR